MDRERLMADLTEARRRHANMIPDEAVEAAMDVLSMYIDERMSENDPNSPYTREGAIEILVAAAPHLTAAALTRAANAFEAQPPQLRNRYVSALRLYAAEPWRLNTCPSECAAKHPGREHAV